jgi:protein tyrosine phosphatase (PTP) superfamily phosphohydrolase (DUF442 family)
MATKDIVNFVEIDGKTGTAGLPTPEQFAAARDEGYEVIVNLLPSTQDNALKGEDAIVRALGFEYHYIPVVWLAPQPENFTDFCAVMKKVEGKKVLIHCAMNMRVTAFFSTYAQKYLGWSTAQADALIARVWDANPNYKMPDVWRAFIETIRQ